MLGYQLYTHHAVVPPYISIGQSLYLGTTRSEHRQDFFSAAPIANVFCVEKQPTLSMLY